MGLSTFTTILLFLVCLLGGVAIGFLLARYLKPIQEIPAEENVEKVPVAKPVFTKPLEPALMQVGRTKKKALWLEMDGQRWEAGTELPPESRQALNTIVQDMGPWLEQPHSTVPGPEAYDPKPARNSPFSRSISPWRNEKKDSSAPEKIISSSSPVSMVTQIDAILQSKLVGTPFSTLDIHILESPTGEVNVKVGAMKHLSVDSIPNHEIQALVRQAVADWEKTTQ